MRTSDDIACIEATLKEGTRGADRSLALVAVLIIQAGRPRPTSPTPIGVTGRGPARRRAR